MQALNSRKRRRISSTFRKTVQWNNQPYNLQRPRSPKTWLQYFSVERFLVENRFFSLVKLHKQCQTIRKNNSPGLRPPAVISHVYLMLLFYSSSLIKQYNTFWLAKDLTTLGKSIFFLIPDRKFLCPKQKSPSQAAKL